MATQKRKKTMAEECIEELRDYTGNDEWNDVIDHYPLDEEKQAERDLECSYQVFFADGSAIYNNGREWRVDAFPDD